MAPLTASTYQHQLTTAFKLHQGETLAVLFDLFDPYGPAPALYQGLTPIEKSLQSLSPTYAETYRRTLKIGPLAEMATVHTQAIILLYAGSDPYTHALRPDLDIFSVFAKQHDLVNALYRWFMSESQPTSWALPLLYKICRDLKRVALMADAVKEERQEKKVHLEEASRLLQKCFSACLNDRSANQLASRKMGVYYMATLLFKVYFKLKSTALCKNLIKGIGAADLADFTNYPIAHQVTYLYYMGVFAFLREDYFDAEMQFLKALNVCHSKSKRNLELILDYLIPVLLLRGVLPTDRLLRRSDRLRAVYSLQWYPPMTELGPAAKKARDSRETAERNKLTPVPPA